LEVSGHGLAALGEDAQAVVGEGAEAVGAALDEAAISGQFSSENRFFEAMRLGNPVPERF
jgi:hypothetical protein